MQIECVVHYPDTETSTVEKLEEQVALLTSMLLEQTKEKGPAV